VPLTQTWQTNCGHYLFHEYSLSTLSRCSLYLHINGHFPGGIADTRISAFWILLQIRMMDVVETTGAISRAKLHSKCHQQQTNIQFFTGRMPFLSPNQQCQSTERSYKMSLFCLEIHCPYHLTTSLPSRTVSRHICLNCHTVSRSDDLFDVDRCPCSDSRHVTAPYKSAL